MHKFFVFFLFTVMMTHAFGQYSDSLKAGIYPSLSDLLINKPQYECGLSIKKRSDFDIKMVAGNDYKIESNVDSIKSSTIKKAFAVYDGKNLYVNGIYINGGKYFCLVVNNNRIILLKAGIPKLSKRKALGYKREMLDIQYTPIGGAVGGAINGAQLAMVRFYYCIDSKTGAIKILAKEWLGQVLSEYPEIKSEFDKDLFLDKQENLVRYVEKINKK